METTIFPNQNGDPSVNVRGDLHESPEVVAKGYLAAVKVLRDAINTKEETND